MMPLGVEHGLFCGAPRVSRLVILALMPLGVEHETQTRPPVEMSPE